MVTSRKQPAERVIEAMTWASVVIWLGFTLIAHLLGYVWLVMLVLSVILLSSAIYQRSRKWETSLSIWVFGIWMAVFSVLEIVSQMIAVVNGGSGLDVDIWVYLGVALVSMGVATVFNMVTPSLGTHQNVSRRPNDYEYDRERDYAPRRVDQDLSSAWVPAAQDSAQYNNQSRSRSRSASRSASRSSTANRSSGSSARQYAQQVDDPFDRAGAAYGGGQDDYYEEAPPRDSRRARRVDDTSGWETPAYDQPAQAYQGERLSRQRGRGHSQPQRSPQRAPRSAPAQRQPSGSDLESRVEDIIRRSREQRGTVPHSEDLPY